LETLNGKLVFGERASLVHAQIFDAAELFRRVHFLQQNVPFEKVHRAECEEERRRDHEALRHEDARERAYLLHDADAGRVRRNRARRGAAALPSGCTGGQRTKPAMSRSGRAR